MNVIGLKQTKEVIIVQGFAMSTNIKEEMNIHLANRYVSMNVDCIMIVGSSGSMDTCVQRSA